MVRAAIELARDSRLDDTCVTECVATPRRVDRHGEDRGDRVLGARGRRQAQVRSVASEVGRVVVGERVVRRRMEAIHWHVEHRTLRTHESKAVVHDTTEWQIKRSRRHARLQVGSKVIATSSFTAGTSPMSSRRFKASDHQRYTHLITSDWFWYVVYLCAYVRAAGTTGARQLRTAYHLLEYIATSHGRCVPHRDGGVGARHEVHHERVDARRLGVLVAQAAVDHLLALVGRARHPAEPIDELLAWHQAAHFIDDLSLARGAAERRDVERIGHGRRIRCRECPSEPPCVHTPR